MLAACGGDGDDEQAQTTATETTQMQDVAIESPASDLRLTLDRLLGEHAVLAVFAMPKGVAGEPDFEPIAGALHANTEALGEAIGSVYGQEAQQSFLKMWRDHIGFFVDYTVATAKNDKQGRQQALDRLAGYKGQFSNFLDQATRWSPGRPATCWASQHADPRLRVSDNPTASIPNR